MDDRKMILEGRPIYQGEASGPALVSGEPISFYGGVDPDTGRVIEAGHPLEGKTVKGTILVFPHGKGSTVGSYILYRLKKRGLAPGAIINSTCDPVVAVGAIIAEIPCIDLIDIGRIATGRTVRVDAARGVVEI